MPSLLEQIAMARQSTNPVSVYSPTQPIYRPTGGMATAGTARQIIQGGAGGGYQAPSQYPQTQALTQLQQPEQLDLVQPQPLPAGPMTLTQMLAQATQEKQQYQAEHPGGILGTLGTVVNSPIAKAIMAPLYVLDTPRRAIISGINEVADAFNGGDASFSDWLDQTKDANFGFGDVVGSTGNLWVDRFVGFAGDVLLDPLTYIGGSQTLAGIGRAARVDGSIKAIASGASEDIAQQIGRIGYSGFDATQRAELRAAGHLVRDPGLYFHVPFVHKRMGRSISINDMGEITGGAGFRLPFSGKIDQGVTRALAGTRAWVNETMPGMSRLRAWRAPIGYEQAFEKLVTGRGKIGTAEAAMLVSFQKAKKAIGNTYRGTVNAEAQRLFRGTPQQDLMDMVETAETVGGTPLNDWADFARARANDYGVDIPKRTNYFPHLVTADAINWLKGKDPNAQNFANVFGIGPEIDDVAPSMLERKFIPRDEPYKIGGTKDASGKWTGGTDFYIRSGTIKEFNDQFAQHFPDLPFKFFDDNPTTVIPRYLIGMSDSVGVVGGARHLLNSKSNLITGYADDGALKEVIDDVASGVANKAEADKLRAQQRALGMTIADMKDDTYRGVAGIQGILGTQMRGALEEVTSLSDDTKIRLGNLLIEEQALADQVGVANPNLIGPPAPGTLEVEFNRAMAELDGKMDELDKQMAKVAQRAAAEQRIWAEAQTMAVEERTYDPKALADAMTAWNDALVARTQLVHDRDTIQALQDRLKQYRLKARIAQEHIVDPHFLSMMAGEDVRHKVPPRPGEVRTEGGEYRLTGWSPIVMRDGVPTDAYSEPRIRAMFQERRNRLLGNTPQVQDFGARIETQHGKLVAAENEYERLRGIHTEAIQEAEDALNALAVHRALLLSQLHDMSGPGLWEARQTMQRQIREFEKGALAQAQEHYNTISRPVFQAKGEMKFQQKMLDRLKRQQEEAAKGSAVAGAARPEASTQTGPFVPEKLPYTPQRIGQATASKAQAQKELATWGAGPDAARVSALDRSNDLLAREKAYNDSQFRENVQGLYGMFTLDPQGNVVWRLDFIDRAGREAVKERDDALRAWKRAQDQVDWLQEYQLRAFAEDTRGYPEALVARDEAYKTYRAAEDRIIHENLQTYEGTNLGRKMEEVLGYQRRSEELGIEISQNKDQITKLTRKRSQLQQRIDTADAILNQQADMIARNNRGLAKLNPEALEANFRKQEWLEEEIMRLRAYREPARRPTPRLEGRERFRHGEVVPGRPEHQAALDERIASLEAQLSALKADTQGAVPPSVILDEQIARLNKAEEEMIRRTRSQTIGQRPLWEPVEDLPFSQREGVISPSPEIPQVYELGRFGGLPRLTGTRMPGGVQEPLTPLDVRGQLEHAYHVLRFKKMYEALGADQEIARARDTIKVIESNMGPGETWMQMALNRTLDDAADEVARLQRDRIPFSLPPEGTAARSAIVDFQRGGVAGLEKGGDMRLSARAQRAADALDRQREAVEQLNAGGALNQDDLNWLFGEANPQTGQREGGLYSELDRVRRIHDGNQLDPVTKQPLRDREGRLLPPSPSRPVMAQLEQLTMDADMWSEFIQRYKVATDMGVAPNDSLASYLWAKTLGSERAILEAKEASISHLLRDDVYAKRMADYELKWTKLQNTVEQQETIVRNINDEAQANGWKTDDIKRHDPSLYNRKLKAQQKMAEAKRQQRDLKEPDTGFVDAEVEAIVDILAKEIEHVDTAAWEVRNARDARKWIDYPQQERARLEVSVPHYAGQIEELKMSVNRQQNAINKAKRLGNPNVRYSPFDYYSGRQRITMSVEDAEAQLHTFPPHLQEEIRVHIRQAKEAGAENVDITTKYNKKVVEIPLEQAEAQIAGDRATIDSMETMKQADEMKLSVFDGTSAIEKDRWKTLLKDQQEPPDVNVLQSRLDRLRSKREMSPGDQRRAEFLEQRIDHINVPATPEEISDWQTKLARIESMEESIQQLLDMNLDRLQAAIDGGQEFLTSLINGQRPPTQHELLILRDIFGAGGDENARQLIEVFNAALGERQYITEEDSYEILDMIRGMLPEGQTIGEFITQNVQRAIAEGTATADTYRSELINAMVASAKATHINTMREFSQTFKGMGLRTFSGRTRDVIENDLRVLDEQIARQAAGPTKAQKARKSLLEKELNYGLGFSNKPMMQMMGYKMSRGTLDRHQLKEFVINQFQMMGFNPTQSLENALLTTRLRLNRIKTMQHGLGYSLRQKKFKHLSTEEFFRKWMDESPGINDLDPRRDFNELMDVVRDMEEVAPPATIPGADVTPGVAPTSRTPQEIQAEINQHIGVMADDMSEANVARYEQLEQELALARGEVPAGAAEPEPLPGPEPPPAAAAPPPAAPPPKGGKRKWQTVDAAGTSVSDDGYTKAPAGGGQWRITGPNGEDLGTFGLNREINAAIDAHGGGVAPSPTAAAAPPPEGPDVEALRAELADIEAQLDSGAADVTNLIPRHRELTEQLEALEAAPPPATAVPEAEAPTLPPAEEGGAPPDLPETPEAEAAVQQVFRLPEGMTQPEFDARAIEILSQVPEIGPRTAVEIVRHIDTDFGGWQGIMAGAQETNMSPYAFLRYMLSEQRNARLANRFGDQVVWNWRTIAREGGPRWDVARRLRGRTGEFDNRVGTIVGARARASGNFSAESLAAREAELSRPLNKIRGAQAQLSRMGQEAAENASATEQQLLRSQFDMDQNEAWADTLEAASTEQAGYLAGEDVAKAARDAASLNEQQLRALQVERGQVGMDRWRAMQSYNQELNQADMDLGKTRTAIMAAHDDVAHLDATKVQLERTLNTTPQKTQDLTSLIQDMRIVNGMRKGMPGVTDNDLVSVEAMLDSAIDAQMRLNNLEITDAQIIERLKQFDDGQLIVNPQMKRVVRDGWEPLAAQHIDPETPDGIFMAESLAKAFKNVNLAMDSGALWKMVEKYTAFFKTFATATPGFHVRNALTAVFMNMVDGVKMTHMSRAPGLWGEFKKNPREFWNNADERTRMAFAMVFGSGAGGQFMERGLGPEADFGGRAYRALMNNALTRFNKRMGEWVEGPARLAMALDSVDRGMDVMSGMGRVERFHFNYEEVSRLDVKAKKLIPFWTFMSRNFPLQIMQMWATPKVYAWYQSFVRNFGEVADPLTPDYWLAQGAFTMDENASKRDSPWYLAPDLPHLRVSEPFVAAAQGNWGKAILSDINPAFLVPFEAYAAKQKFYTGAPVEGYEEPGGVMKALTPLFDLLGQTATGGTSGNEMVKASALHMARQLIPPLGLAERLTSGTGTRAGRVDETLIRTLTGAPVYQLTDAMRQSTLRSRYFDEREKYETQAELARS